MEIKAGKRMSAVGAGLKTRAILLIARSNGLQRRENQRTAGGAAG